ncbi:MAG: tRNA 2-selenouridine(34) synthase MnmH [Bacteroidetes bacterium]|nr:tRNA 2-selenouridine(34) synthase MnmH [Bacteroidota bacterium]
MPRKLNAAEFLERSNETPIADVRSPMEFSYGHIPGAVNLPLFTDEERAIVGTIYKNSGRDAAVLKGLELAGPKMAEFVKDAYRIAPHREILVHCWRGGMRSEQMAWLFEQAGFKAYMLEGGYKAYRKFIRNEFSGKSGIIVLGGLTGSGKTEILQELKRAGEQIIDLEFIAHHKGSAFGALGQTRQPTNEQFENNLYTEWRKLDFSKRTWIEDESRMIGNVTIPDPLFEIMSKAPLVIIGVDLQCRINRLIMEYAHFPKEELAGSISKIAEKLGGARTVKALDDLAADQYDTIVTNVLLYYDKAYLHAVSGRINKTDVETIQVTGTDAASDAPKILQSFKENPEIAGHARR